MLVLLVVLVVMAVAILGALIVVAMGRGGEMAPSAADVRPLDNDIVTAADVALLRPPAALWGYDMRATDEALNKVVRTMTERDVEIAALRRQLADMQSAAADARAAVQPRYAASPWDTARRDEPDLSGMPGPPDPGPPPALPFRRSAGGPTRPPAGEHPWSAWERPGPGQPDPGERPQSESGGRG